MIRWFRNLVAAIAFGVAGFTARKNTVVDRPAAPIEDEKHTDLVAGGTVQRYVAPTRQERTIAGGPGSQKIGDTFDALPKEVRDQMIAARGRGGYNRASGRQGQNPDIRQLRPGEDSDAQGGYVPQRDPTDAIAKALGEKYTRDPKTGRLVWKGEEKKS